MGYNSDIHHRQSVRLKGYDYSQEGVYFVTICTQNRERLFGEITNQEMLLNDSGKLAEQCWREIPKHYPFVILDKFIVMPNHIHGIICIQHNTGQTNIVGANNYLPITNDNSYDRANNNSPLRIRGTSQTIGAIVRGYKIGVTKWFHTHTDIDAVWQRNYYEHVIRNEQSLNTIREYIINNPANWEKDKLFK